VGERGKRQRGKNDGDNKDEDGERRDNDSRRMGMGRMMVKTQTQMCVHVTMPM
jgi:hypothetical protein